MSRHHLFLIMCFLTIVLYFAFFGQHGLVSSIKLMKEHHEILASVESIKVKNNELTKEIKLVETGSSYVEQKAREVLGLVRDDEIIYEFND